MEGYTPGSTRMGSKKNTAAWNGLMELSMKASGRMEFSMEKENCSKKESCNRKVNGKEALLFKAVLRMWSGLTKFRLVLIISLLKTNQHLATLLLITNHHLATLLFRTNQHPAIKLRIGSICR
jgi:hypothetical protein